jgi:hypothetical protein
VVEARRGTRHYFAIRPQTVAELRNYFESMWQQALRAYAQHVEHEESKHGSPGNRHGPRRR